MTAALSPSLAALVAECLHLPVGAIDPRLPLTGYGLDSLGTHELTVAIERLLGRELPASLLLDHPDLVSIERFIAGLAGVSLPSLSPREQMRADCRLPAEIRPASGARPGKGAVLLTGATGFLGGHLLRALVAAGTKVVCLARASGGRSGRERLGSSLEALGIPADSLGASIEAVDGDLSLPLLGLSEERYAALAGEIDAVYHAGADLSWIGSYAALRAANVLGTRELLRLACRTAPKPLHLVSSASVCASTCGPREVEEADDMLAHLGGIHLGYAQTKCVAEALVRQAGERGLPVTIFRPALIAGDRATGTSNTDDLLSRLIKAAVLMGAAPDLDWNVDCCPVDYVAEAVVRLAGTGDSPGVYHLVSPAPRHWRELALWMNLFGYPVRLLPYRAWLERLRGEAAAPGHPLRELMPFFTHEPAGEGGLTLPELFEETRRSRIRDGATRKLLRRWPLGDPGLGANLLDRYFRAYIASGFLPPVAAHRRRRTGPAAAHLDAARLTALLRRCEGEPALTVLDAARCHDVSGHSIISELTSWRHGSAAGLERYRVTVVRAGARRETRSVVLKRKARDHQVIDVARRIAEQCSPALGRAFRRFGREIGLAGCDAREVGIYRQRDARFRLHAPALIGTLHDRERGERALVLEDIAGLELLDSADDISGWSPARIEAAIRGLAELHAVWYGRERELLRRTWLGPVVSASRREQMLPLWKALAEFAAPHFAAAGGRDLPQLQERLLASVGARWRKLDGLPRTLIHNDFNPRNLALRREGAGWRLCAYDWELAAIGAPQHDCAELLCFVLLSGSDPADVRRYVALHRDELERASGRPVPAEDWDLGFRLALHDLLVDRFAMYAMIDRFRPQRFLGRVVATWRALYEHYPLEEERRR